MTRLKSTMYILFCCLVMITTASALVVGDFYETKKEQPATSLPPPAPPTPIDTTTEEEAEESDALLIAVLEEPAPDSERDTKPEPQEEIHAEEIKVDREEASMENKSKELQNDTAPTEKPIEEEKVADKPQDKEKTDKEEKGIEPGKPKQNATKKEPLPPLEQWRDNVMLKLKEEIKQENETAHNQSDHPVGENEGVVKAERNNPVLSDGYLDSFNYASTECGAKILASSEKSQSMDNLLKDTRENYGNSPCASDKWFVIELCEEIGINSIEIANFEFFSSTFKDFQISGSFEWPSTKWIHIANFTAQNVRKVQLFQLEEPKWFKYLKVSVITHYGSQYYCPITVVRVHGTNHVTDLKEKMLQNSKEVNELTQRLDRAKELIDFGLKKKPKTETAKPTDEHVPPVIAEHDPHKVLEESDKRPNAPPDIIPNSTVIIDSSQHHAPPAHKIECHNDPILDVHEILAETPQTLCESGEGSPSPHPSTTTTRTIPDRVHPDLPNSTMSEPMTTTIPTSPTPSHTPSHTPSTSPKEVGPHSPSTHKPVDMPPCTPDPLIASPEVKPLPSGHDNNHNNKGQQQSQQPQQQIPGSEDRGTEPPNAHDKPNYGTTPEQPQKPKDKETSPQCSTEPTTDNSRSADREPKSHPESPKPQPAHSPTPTSTPEDSPRDKTGSSGEKLAESPETKRPDVVVEPGSIIPTEIETSLRLHSNTPQPIASASLEPSPMEGARPIPATIEGSPKPDIGSESQSESVSAGVAVEGPKKKKATETVLEKIKDLLRQANEGDATTTTASAAVSDGGQHHHHHHHQALNELQRAERLLREEVFAEEHIATDSVRYTQESVFTTLANRIKSLEINQSLSNRYLDKVTEELVETIDELEKFKAERISLLNTLQIVAEITNDLATQYEATVKAEVERQMEVANTKMREAFKHEMELIHQQVKVGLIQERNEQRVSIIVIVFLFYILFHYTHKLIYATVSNALKDAYTAIKPLFTPSYSTSYSSAGSTSPSLLSSAFFIPTPPPPPSLVSPRQTFPPSSSSRTNNNDNHYLEVSLYDSSDEEVGEKENQQKNGHNKHNGHRHNGHNRSKAGQAYANNTHKRKLASRSCGNLKELVANSNSNGNGNGKLKDKQGSEKRKKRKKA